MCVCTTTLLFFHNLKIVFVYLLYKLLLLLTTYTPMSPMRTSDNYEDYAATEQAVIDSLATTNTDVNPLSSREHCNWTCHESESVIILPHSYSRASNNLNIASRDAWEHGRHWVCKWEREKERANCHTSANNQMPHWKLKPPPSNLVS